MTALFALFVGLGVLLRGALRYVALFALAPLVLACEIGRLRLGQKSHATEAEAAVVLAGIITAPVLWGVLALIGGLQ